MGEEKEYTYKDFYPELMHLCERRSEFNSISLDRQGELLHKLGEVMAEFANATGLKARFLLKDDTTIICPDCEDELMTMTVEYDSTREGFFEMTLDCPMCGAAFGGGCGRSEDGGRNFL